MLRGPPVTTLHNQFFAKNLVVSSQEVLRLGCYTAFKSKDYSPARIPCRAITVYSELDKARITGQLHGTQGELEMNYYVSKIVDGPFEEAVARVKKVMADEGFGLISDIDVQKMLKDRLNVTFRKYRILGACNPLFAHKALLTEDKIGTMLPCNMIVQENAQGRIEIENTVLIDIAGQVRHKISRVIDQL